MEAFKGWKTYAVAVGVVLVGVGQYLSGSLDLVGLVNYLLAGAGAAALRHAISGK